MHTLQSYSSSYSSGAMYSGVPTQVRATRCAPIALASPRSPTFTSPELPLMKMFSS
jgi:hypothetical protein